MRSHGQQKNLSFWKKRLTTVDCNLIFQKRFLPELAPGAVFRQPLRWPRSCGLLSSRQANSGGLFDNSGCRGFTGPVPPPLWMSVQCTMQLWRGSYHVFAVLSRRNSPSMKHICAKPGDALAWPHWGRRNALRGASSPHFWAARARKPEAMPHPATDSTNDRLVTQQRRLA